jgi:hypothetical protein
MTFRGITINLKEDPRCGVCNGCRAVLGEVDAETGKFYRGYYLGKGFDLHHEFYDFKNVLAHTIEVCRTCHGRYNKEQGIFKYRYHSSFDEGLVQSLYVNFRGNKEKGTVTIRVPR